jgi:PAS domain S-box-containing protein
MQAAALRAWQRIAHTIGRRGVVLLFIALLSAAIAMSMLAPTGTQSAALGRLIPAPVWASMWAAVSVLCLVQAFVRKDRVAFTAAIFATTVWASMYLVAWLAGLSERGWLAATIYYALAIVALTVSTWPEALVMPTAVPDGYPDAVVTADKTGTIIGWAGAAEKVFGWPAGEVVGQPITMLMPHRYRDAHLAGFARVAMGGRSRLAGQLVEVAGLRRDGSEFPAQVLIGAHDTAFTSVIRDTSP